MKPVSILLSTYNGEKYLKEQLDSLLNQSYKNIEILARDDGSSDTTVEILKSYNIKLLETTQNLGAKGSFSELLKYAVANREVEYFMFCDQDDVWEADKIEKTLAKMKQMETMYKDMPLLVHTNLKVTDENLNILDKSFWHYEYIDPTKNQFNRLLIQNTITGCTMMINRDLAELSLPISDDSVMHDWWIGLVASKFGKIGFIQDATIKYRQHSANDTGAKRFSYFKNFKSALGFFRKKKNFLSHHKINILQAQAFLNTYQDDLDKYTNEMLEKFSNIEKLSFMQRRILILKYQLFKCGTVRNLGMLVQV